MRRAFYGVELDVQESRLLRDGTEIELEPRAFDLLCYLVKHANRLVTKQELKREVWQTHRLSDGVTANAVAKLRRALGQPGDARTPIETVRGRGYRFHLEEARGPVGAASLEEHIERSPPTQDPFVGREGPLANLIKKLERASVGRGSLVLVCGQAGIGKTRLVRELSVYAAQRGIPTWTGSAYEGERFSAYWPWVQVLREAQQGNPAAFAQALPADAVLLPRWIPGPRAADLAPEPVEPQTIRSQLFDELTRCLGSLSTHSAALVVLDDLQWADAASIDLLAYAARSLEGRRLMFVATLRDDEPPSSPSVDNALTKLGRIAARVQLSGLSEQESRSLALAFRTDASLPDQRLHELFERTGGSPFFIRQFLEWWDESELATGDVAEELPPAARDVLRRKVELLPPEVQRVISGASVLGPRFRASRLGEVLGESMDLVLEALVAATRLSIVRRQPGTDEFAFTHALLHESLYESLDVRARGALHARAADVLGAQDASADAAQLSELARHLIHALPSRLDEAVEACAVAAKAAQQSAGFERAGDLLALAIAKLEVEGTSARKRARLLIELGNSHFFVAAVDLAWDAYRAAAQLARDTRSADILAEVAPRLVDCIEIGTGNADFARVLVEEALKDLPADANRERASLLATKAELAIEFSPAERTALLDEADACADSPVTRLVVARSRAIMRDPTTLNSNALAADALEALLDAHERDCDAVRYRSVERLTVHLTRYVCALAQCDLPRADRALSHIARLAESSRVRAVEMMLRLTRAGRAYGDGRLDDLDALVTGWAAPGAAESAILTEAFRSYQLLLAQGRGRMELFAKVELPELPDSIGAAPRQRTDCIIMRAYFYLKTHRHDRARALLARVPANEIERMPVLFGDLGVLCGLSELYIGLGDEPAARAIYDKLRPFAGYNVLYPTFAYRGAVDYYLGLLAVSFGQGALAREHFQAALAINQKLGMPIQVSEARAALQALE